jgi:hypothetical protein
MKWRPATPGHPDVRGALLGKLRDRIGRMGPFTNRHPWVRQAAAIQAGETIEVPAWELPGRPADYGLTANDRARVHPDGTVTRVVSRA